VSDGLGRGCRYAGRRSSVRTESFLSIWDGNVCVCVFFFSKVFWVEYFDVCDAGAVLFSFLFFFYFVVVVGSSSLVLVSPTRAQPKLQPQSECESFFIRLVFFRPLCPPPSRPARPTELEPPFFSMLLGGLDGCGTMEGWSRAWMLIFLHLVL
jgi:hypothetical protein